MKHLRIKITISYLIKIDLNKKSIYLVCHFFFEIKKKFLFYTCQMLDEELDELDEVDEIDEDRVDGSSDDWLPVFVE